MIRRALLALALMALGWGSPALAWGALGHRTIAAIAAANISPHTATAIAALLRAAPDVAGADCPLANLADASVWPDCVRSRGGEWASTAPWHYQDGPVCAGNFDPAVACPDGNCVTAQIARQRAILTNRAASATARLQALAFLTHFVGDVHQPFHTADDNDRGGNIEQVSNAWALGAESGWGGRGTSLHALWDTGLVSLALAGRPSLAHPYSPATRAHIATGREADWARESWQIAVAVAYPQALGAPACGTAPPARVSISPAAVARDLPLVRGRLVQAGLRLARELDADLAKG